MAYPRAARSLMEGQQDQLPELKEQHFVEARLALVSVASQQLVRALLESLVESIRPAPRAVLEQPELQALQVPLVLACSKLVLQAQLAPVSGAPQPLVRALLALQSRETQRQELG